MLLGLLLMMIGVALTTVGGYVAKDGFDDRKKASSGATMAALDFERKRALAFLVGYEGALALASAIQATGPTNAQRIAAINVYLVDLGMSSLQYPTNPLGAARDAAPASEFAQKAAGSLAAKDTRFEAAFVLGWYGVIATDSPSVANPSFTVRSYVHKAGFPASPDHLSDRDVVQGLADDAKALLATIPSAS